MKKEASNSIAPEQYELLESPAPAFSMNRRHFFKTLGSGIAITFTVAESLSAPFDDAQAAEDGIGAWIHINEKGMVTVYTGKAEVGQNIRTSLAQAVADELEVPMDKIAMVMGDTALTPYDRGTFGSRSTPYMAPQLRKAAASAREVLINLAAKRMNWQRADLFAENGVVKNRKTGKSIPFGELTEGKKLIKPVNESVALKPVNEWKVSGTSVPKVNGQSFITGQHKYTSDMRLPGMLFGKVLRAPSFQATLSSVDLSVAKSIPGVIAVRDGDFVGIAAPDTKTAEKALKAIKAEWKTLPQPSRKELFDLLRTKADGVNDEEVAGNVDDAFAKANIKVERTLFVDYIAHAPLEPRAGLAQWTDGRLTVWTGTQRPFGVQEDLSQLFSLSKENVRVIQPDTGSGYGGKHTGEAGIEAARLARAANKPVKVVWTREEEFTWAYFRPAGVIEIKAGANNDGIVTSWEFHNYNSGASGIKTSYEVANKRVQYHSSDSPLRQGSYRGLAATANVFARECVMNDIAAELKADPLEFRLKNLKDERMINVLKAVAEKFDWNGKPRKSGTGAGIACGTEKGSYVAACAEVMVDEDEVRVVRAAVAFECGAIVNPNHLENQIQGAVIQGLGGALFEWIDFRDGRILNPLFSKYRVPRFGDIPELQVVMLNRKDIPSAGAGETPIVGIAPAIRNAIADATAKKLYMLPLVPNGLPA